MDVVCGFHQEAPDFVNSLGLRVDVALQNPDANPVLDPFSTSAWEFSVSPSTHEACSSIPKLLLGDVGSEVIEAYLCVPDPLFQGLWD